MLIYISKTPKFSLTLSDSDPLLFYSQTTLHCRIMFNMISNIRRMVIITTTIFTWIGDAVSAYILQTSVTIIYLRSLLDMILQLHILIVITSRTKH